MDKDAFFSAIGLKSTVAQVPGTEMEITLRELSAGQREKMITAAKDQGIHTMSAMTVAMSCPDLNDDDYKRLLDEVNPEALLELSQKVYEISSLSTEARKEAKKG